MPITVAFFDCETNGVGPDAAITCASVADNDGNVTSYHSGYAEYMSPAIGIRLLEDLLTFDRVVTFNGAAFDFKKLFELTQDERVKTLAKESVDLMLQFTSQSGFYSSMDSFAKGTFGGDKSMAKTNTGGWAATAWFQGEGEKVLAYCESDVKVLKNLYSSGLMRGQLIRVTKQGKSRPWVISTEPGDNMFKSATNCLADWVSNPPNTSWMTDPPNLSESLKWWE